jgi:hypothetical protein
MIKKNHLQQSLRAASKSKNFSRKLLAHPTDCAFAKLVYQYRWDTKVADAQSKVFI